MTKAETKSTMFHIRKSVASLEEGVQGVSHGPKALLLTILSWVWGECLKILPFQTSGPFLSKPLWHKKKPVLEWSIQTASVFHQPNHLVQSNCWISGDGTADGFLKWGPHHVTNHSGNEIIGLRSMKTEGITHMLIHTTTHKPIFESARLSFGKTSSGKTFARITFNSDNLTDPFCL